MAEDFKMLFNGFAPVGSSSVYAVQTDDCIVKYVKATNVHPSNSSTTFKIWIGPTTSEQYVWLDEVTLARGESVEWSGSLALDALQKFHAQSGFASSIALKISGMEIT